MFCCDFSLSTGMRVILSVHLLVCCVVVVSGLSNILFHMPMVSHANSFRSQLLSFAFSLCGIPIILAAFWGVSKRIETTARIYLSYLLLMLLVDLAISCDVYLLQDACAYISVSLIKVAGEAFACGVARTSSYAFVAISTALEVYCALAVWSYCEELSIGANMPPLSDLLPDDEAIKKRQERQDDSWAGPLAGIIGMVQQGVPGPYAGQRAPRNDFKDNIIASPYGTLEQGIVGSTLFGGDTHEEISPLPVIII